MIEFRASVFTFECVAPAGILYKSVAAAADLNSVGNADALKPIIVAATI